MKRLLTYFMQGFMLLAPLAITLYVILLIFNWIDEPLRALLAKYTGITIPGAGLLLIIIFITLTGFLSKYILTNPVRRFGHKLLEKAPILKLVYSSLTDLFSAFVGKEKKFNVPVLVCINKENSLWKLGFMTQQSMEQHNIPGLVAVYFPHSYNFSGELYLVEPSAVRKLDMLPAETMKFIVSGGVTHIE
ncbi:MAG: DUF502 domain-containing protein [Bacteroidales bacterium]|jgi:uncharacterized membrane protein|nr:DUF502 domain-containing protein [Bacteroidales bacterium]